MTIRNQQVDRTFNLGSLYLTAGVTKNRSLVKNTSTQSSHAPIFPCFLILHSSGKEELYNVAFSTLFQRMNALHRKLQASTSVAEKSNLAFNFKFDFRVLEGDLTGRDDIMHEWADVKDVTFNFGGDSEPAIINGLVKQFFGSLHLKCINHVYKDGKEYLRRNKLWDVKTQRRVRYQLSKRGIANTKDVDKVLGEVRKLRHMFSLLEEKHRLAMDHYLRTILLDIWVPSRIIGLKECLWVSEIDPVI